MNRGATPRCHQLTRQNYQTQCNQQNYNYIGIKSIKNPLNFRGLPAKRESMGIGNGNYLGIFPSK